MERSLLWVWLMGWMSWWAFWDWKYRVIYTWQAILVLVVGLVWQLAAGTLWSGDVLGGILLGLSLLGVSYVTQEAFGMGDGLVILILGLYHGFAMALAMTATGLLLASVVAVGILVFGHGSRKQSLPLIPFLMAAYLWISVAGG